jgi:hypothetical protein
MKEILLYTLQTGDWVAEVVFTAPGQHPAYSLPPQIKTVTAPQSPGQRASYARAACLREANAIISAWERFGCDPKHPHFETFFNAYVDTRENTALMDVFTGEFPTLEEWQERMRHSIGNCAFQGDEMGCMIGHVMLKFTASDLAICLEGAKGLRDHG